MCMPVRNLYRDCLHTVSWVIIVFEMISVFSCLFKNELSLISFDVKVISCNKVESGHIIGIGKVN